MSYKCRICGTNDVDHPGDVCELCALGEDPYASAISGSAPQPMQSGNIPARGEPTGTPAGKSRKILLGGGASLVNRDPYGNDIAPAQTENEVHVYQAGQVPAAPQTVSALAPAPAPAGQAQGSVPGGSVPLTTGITKNITVDRQKKTFLQRWFRSLISSVPYTMDNDITMFQVYPDYSGTTLNAMGNACDQVIIYGTMNAGAIAENNEVEVYGRRDSSNNIIATRVRNVASGTIVTPYRTIPAMVVMIITLAVLGLLAFAVSTMGTTGIVWAVVFALCLLNLPLVLKIVAALIGIIFSIIKGAAK